ncbi:uncharacterized protein LOC123395933 [Hordeum vulgare subsp. vulgare]|uniref:F-box domain-containing protein n=1 Tax=Hordeum vulgare subsp. vulgare TaxID=112509 RepID=A0A8I6XXK4_HORVV|nr:uncharacterized protein LOC123395933 [Hordeum vulgare subsp. vulgare]
MAMAGPSTTLPPPPPEKAVDVLPVDSLRDILRRLSLADLLRAALACHRWRRVASRCLPRTAPLLGYFFHPTATGLPPPMHTASKDIVIETPAVFSPIDASAPNLSLDFVPEASRFVLHDCHQGLLLLEPLGSLPKGILPRLLVIDPATRRRVLLPPPPRDTVPDDQRWRRSRHYVGSALLSRAHPSKLCFEVVCVSVDGGHPRAWVVSVDDGQCHWRALPRTTEVEVSFDPWWFETRCVHAAGKLYWHICNSGRVLALDPSTLHFSYLRAPAELPRFGNYRVGETPDDGRLCIATVEDQVMRVWVRGETRWSDDNGWHMEREMNLSNVYDTVPGLPKDKCHRIFTIWLSDMDAGRTGKLFIRTMGYGRYSLDLDTAKMERLHTKHGKEYGDPICAYFLAWPPAFLAPEN